MQSEMIKYRALGIMSGTSLDGLDMAICQFKFESGKWEYKIEKSKEIAYPAYLYNQLKNAFSSSAAEIAHLHTSFGRYIGDAAKDFLIEQNTEIDLIASHGQTIFHAPDQGYTFQIGNGAEIAAKTKVLTVCDFRSLDVAKGGQGAPLVPIGDKLLFHDYAACLNLGGFSNVSYDNASGIRMAFDICPVNFVLNRLANKFDLAYDSKGELAHSGSIIFELLDDLNKNNYYKQLPPKSLGQEWVEKNVFPFLNSEYRTIDILRTYCEHVSVQIAQELNKIPGKNVLLTGGGCYNDFLIKLISDKCSKRLIIPKDELVNMKEALLFAFLGVLRVRGEHNSLASVTGAFENSVNGAIYHP